MILPDWETINRKRDAGETLNPLEQFVYENEPAGGDDVVFREALLAAIDYARTSAGDEPK
jgi:hypothetical protein